MHFTVERNQVPRCFNAAKTVFTAMLVATLSGCAANSTVTSATATAPLMQIDDCTSPGPSSFEAIVRVATGDGADGSGVVVDHNRVITAAHVIEDDDVTLVWVDNGYRPAQVLATDMKTDLALLSVSTGLLQPLRLAQTGPRQQEPVWAVGYPLALDLTTTHGEFQKWNNGSLFTSAPIKAGNSGGGLLRCEHGRFELAGMVRAYGAVYRDGELYSLEDSLSISVPASTIQAFINRAPRSL